MASRTHEVSDWKKREALKLRVEENMTYAEIADQMGVSKAYVALLLKDSVKKPNFHRWAWDSTPYPVLTQWMNEHQMSKMQLATALGYAPSSKFYRSCRNSCRNIADIVKFGKISR